MSLPWFAFNVKAFITDTMRLSTEAKGAYLLLMLDYYEQGKPAPDDDEVLASITGLAIETWRRHRRVVEPLFTLVDGFWRHKRCDEEIATASTLAAKRSAAGKKANETRWAADPDRTPIRKPKRTPDRIRSGHATDTERSTVSEAEFGPDRTKRDQTVPGDQNNADRIHSASESDTASDRVRSPSTIHIDINTEVREGANAPSSAIGLSIGSLIPDDFYPTGEACSQAKADGVTGPELAEWIDDWKGRCEQAGTRLDDWQLAWQREYKRRIETQKPKAKPRVSVSKPPKKPKAEGCPMPDDWQLTPDLIAFAHKYRQDPHFIADELRNYCENNPTKYSNHDAAFRTFVLRRAKENGQAQTTRRAPAPGGSSILDAFDRLDATLAGRGGAIEEGESDGQAAVRRLPQG